MCLMSVMTPMEFSRAEYSADHSALFRWNIRICSSLWGSGWYAYSIAGARNHCEESVHGPNKITYLIIHKNLRTLLFTTHEVDGFTGCW
jgi:hypothetical protein